MTTLYSLGALTVAGYQARTGDDLSSDDAISGALVEAESLMEEELRRRLPLEERTEAMRIHRDGRLYPKAYPITACATNVVEGRALLGGIPDSLQIVVFVGVRNWETRATVTYTGGFDADTLPVTLAHAIYDLAQGVLLDRVPIPVGVGSVSVGDVSVSATPSSGGVDAYVQGLTSRIRKYRNRFVS